MVLAGALTASIDLLYGALATPSPERPDDKLRHPYPHLMFRARSSVPGETNAFGWHDAEVGPKQGRRVIVMGNSVVFASDVPKDALISVGVAQRLENRGLPAEVFSAGYVSFNSTQLLTALVHEVPQATPDLVVVLDGYLDFYFALTYDARVGYPFNYSFEERAVLSRRSFLESLVSSVSLWDRLALQMHLPAVGSGDDFKRTILETAARTGAQGAGEAPPVLRPGQRADLSVYCERLVSNWKKMVAFGRGSGFEVLIALQPTADTSDDIQRGYACLRTAVAANSELAARFIDFDAKQPVPLSEFRDSIHPKASQYPAFGRALGDALLEHPALSRTVEP